VDPTALQHTVEHAGIAATGVGFFAGLLFSVNPVAIAAIPVSLAYVVKAREWREAIVERLLLLDSLAASMKALASTDA
jgi:cytochrome c-type biogenesis protein